MLTATLDLSGFREQVQQTRRLIKLSVDRGVGRAAAEGAIEARSSGRFKNRSGELRRNIKARFLKSDGNSVEWELISLMPYSRFVQEGTPPHEIRPKAAHGLKGPLQKGQTRRATGKGPHEHIVGRGRALRWVVGGRSVFARVVHHPGTQPDPFMTPGYFKAERVLFREMDVMQANVANLWR